MPAVDDPSPPRHIPRPLPTLSLPACAQAWEAHTDYIRYVEVHPNRPYIISSSDDMSIKLWDWDRDFECVQVRTLGAPPPPLLTPLGGETPLAS